MDGGATWQAQVSGPGPGLDAVAFVDAQHGWAVGGGGNNPPHHEWRSHLANAGQWHQPGALGRDLHYRQTGWAWAVMWEQRDLAHH